MNIQFSQILFQIVNFSILVGALSYLLFKPIQKIFKDRTKRIEEGQKAAEENITAQKRLESLQKKTKQHSEKKATQIVKEAKDKAKSKRLGILTQAKKDGQILIEKMKNDFETEKNQAMKKMETTMLEAVIAISKKVIGKSLNKKAHTQLINQEIEAIIKTL